MCIAPDGAVADAAGGRLGASALLTATSSVPEPERFNDSVEAAVCSGLKESLCSGGPGGKPVRCPGEAPPRVPDRIIPGRQVLLADWPCLDAKKPRRQAGCGAGASIDNGSLRTFLLANLFAVCGFRVGFSTQEPSCPRRAVFPETGRLRDVDTQDTPAGHAGREADPGR